MFLAKRDDHNRIAYIYIYPSNTLGLRATSHMSQEP
jgi:hypothetical protein